MSAIISLTRTTGSALKSALFVFLGLSTLACSPKARKLFFDIPPPRPESEQVEEALPAETGPAAPAANSARPANAPVYLAADNPNPADLEGERPLIEDTLNWEEAMAMLPKDFMGQPDFAAALREGAIMPRALEPSDRRVEMFRLDFFLPGPVPMFDAYFPHSEHVKWMGCESCHPAVFRYRNNEITMAAINQGEYCGACHGKVAFAPTACKRCHTGMP